MLNTRPAAADQNAEIEACAHAYVAAQELRLDTRLLDAQRELEICMAPQCPEEVRSSCEQWASEVRRALSSVVISVRDQGRLLTNVKVFKNQELWLSKLDGQAVPLDPGGYILRIEALGHAPIDHLLLLRSGEQGRVQIELPLPRDSSTKAAAKGAPDRVQPQPPPSLFVPAVFAGIGIAGVAGFVTFAALGRSEESKLAKSCAPECSEQEIDPVRARYLIGDISLGVGGAALGVAMYLLVRRSAVMAQQNSGLNIAPGSNGVSATFARQF